jgi:type IV secretion system protein VirB6
VAANAGSDGATTLPEMTGTLIITISMIFFMKQVPSYASALAGSMAVGGMSLTSVASKMGGSATSAAKGAAGAANDAYTSAKVGAAVMGAGREEKARGGSMMDRGSAMLAEYTDIHNKARATSKNARLRNAASESGQTSKNRTNKPDTE